MKGNNTMRLNQATMIEAVQYWLEQTQFREGKSPVVESVSTLRTTSGYADEFEVKIAEKDAGGDK